MNLNCEQKISETSERLNYLGITQQVLGPNVTNLFCKNAWTRKNCKTSVSKLFFFFFQNSRLSCHSYSSNKQLFWTPPIFPDQAHVYSGGKYTHTQLQTEKSLAQGYFYFKKVPILITRKQPKNLSTIHWKTGYVS